MRIDVLMFLLGLVCVFAGLWLIVGIPGDTNRQLREFLAVLFFVVFIYIGFDFAASIQARRREQKDEQVSAWDKDYEVRRNNRRVRR